MIIDARSELAVFAESFRSWRRIIASVPTDVRCAFQMPGHTPQPDDEYYLKLGPWPARLAPGAERSRAAKNACKYLRSIGVETSDEVIPSALPHSWWRWC
jgi:hypothetical protein